MAQPDDPGLPRAEPPTHVQDFLAHLDKEEIMILARLINAVRSAYTVCRFFGWLVLSSVALLAAITQLPDYLHKLAGMFRGHP